ncbi:MAG TPA: M14 family zinc carboxypeptidase, partial [Solirubrobacteraceae bacterium]|nr:M14 family zinc carboxypeptidase [Solirubrobacteraceae bacterium]
ELAEGFVRKGQKLLVQACRFRGAARSARLTTSFVALRGASAKASAAGAGGATQLVTVRTPKRADKERLQALGLDLTEHGTATSLEAVLHGNADAERLRAAGFRYTVRIADLDAQSRADRKADKRYAAALDASALPSGRTEYRHLADYELELKQLAMQYPSLTREITLPHPTILGRPVQGIEIATNAKAIDDGRPIFLQMGVHHAREWPSSEHAMEWAYELLRGYGASERVTRLVNATRTIVVPIVNPDGFNISREAPTYGYEDPGTAENFEYKRKNCAISESTFPAYREGPCEEEPAEGLRGTDPNRNYGGLWGGAGASTLWFSNTFRGDAPFSEPETQNIRELQATRNITNLITNHTFSNLVLRPPGVAAMGFPLEEPQYRALGAAMSAHNGYANDPSFQLYDTTGGTEDWTFWTAGSIGYTFEIGDENFHPPFADAVVGEYTGGAGTAGAGRGGNREAYFEMQEATAAPDLHSVIAGEMPKGHRLTITKSFTTETSPVWQDDFGVEIGDPIEFADTLTYTLEGKSLPSRRFEWHVNPSTRPIVAGRAGRDPLAPPQPAITGIANPAGQPAENTQYPAPPYEEFQFEVKGLPQYDNGWVDVHIDWGNPQTDWDLYVVDSAGTQVTSSAGFGDTDEDATMFDAAPGVYTARVVNYDQVGPYDDWGNASVTFRSPDPEIRNPQKEAWQLTCSTRDGAIRTSRSVIVDRGQRVDVGEVCNKARQR